MKTLILTRHATSTWTGDRYAGRSDPLLSSPGWREAEGLARRVSASRLLADPSSLVIASPLRRALDTARIVADAVHRPLLVREEWAEADFGSIEGLTFDEAMAVWPEGLQRLADGDPRLDWPGGEAHVVLQRRAALALEHVMDHPGPVLVVSHGFTLRAVLATALGTDAPGAPGPLPPATLIVLSLTDGHWRLIPERDLGADP